MGGGLGGGGDLFGISKGTLRGAVGGFVGAEILQLGIRSAAAIHAQAQVALQATAVGALEAQRHAEEQFNQIFTRIPLIGGAIEMALSEFGNRKHYDAAIANIKDVESQIARVGQALKDMAVKGQALWALAEGVTPEGAARGKGEAVRAEALSTLEAARAAASAATKERETADRTLLTMKPNAAGMLSYIGLGGIGQTLDEGKWRAAGVRSREAVAREQKALADVTAAQDRVASATGGRDALVNKTRNQMDQIRIEAAIAQETRLTAALQTEDQAKLRSIRAWESEALAANLSLHKDGQKTTQVYLAREQEIRRQAGGQWEAYRNQQEARDREADDRAFDEGSAAERAALEEIRRAKAEEAAVQERKDSAALDARITILRRAGRTEEAEVLQRQNYWRKLAEANKAAYESDPGFRALIEGAANMPPFKGSNSADLLGLSVPRGAGPMGFGATEMGRFQVFAPRDKQVEKMEAVRVLLEQMDKRLERGLAIVVE